MRIIISSAVLVYSITFIPVLRGLSTDRQTTGRLSHCALVNRYFFISHRPRYYLNPQGLSTCAAYSISREFPTPSVVCTPPWLPLLGQLSLLSLRVGKSSTGLTGGWGEGGMRSLVSCSR